MADDDSQVRGSPADDTARPTPQSEAPSQAQFHDGTPQAPTPTPEPVVGPSPTSTTVLSSSSSDASVRSGIEERSALLDRARAFLTSPQIVHEEPAAKRRFLAEKGLNDAEIEGLMRELPPQLPPVPPRTYPQPPPSNLPYLLMGLTKILTWLTGGSAILILFYYKFLLPRLTRSALARRSLKQHQASLLSRLNTSLKSLKETQANTFEVLPALQPKHEPSEFKSLRTLADLISKIGGEGEGAISDIPLFTVLRCALEEFELSGKKSTREELFTFLEERFPWLKTEEGVDYETSLWETLNTNSRFSSNPSPENPSNLVWSYTPPPPLEPTPLASSLSSFTSSLSRVPRHPEHTNPFQGTLDALADVTGYITTQTYQLTTRSSMRIPGASGFGLSSSMTLSPQEEEIRKEIRSLKGLVLNRRTFAPARPALAQTPVPTP